MTPLELRGERVLLRPLELEELDVLHAPHEGLIEPPSDDLEALDRLRRRIESSGRFCDGRLDLGIEAGGELIGSIEARHPPAALPPGVFELGITLFATHDRGCGYGTEATRLLTEHLFAALGAERVQASTDVENTAMRRVFEKLGFAEEGVMRGFMPAGDGRADYVLYGVTKAEWGG